MNPVHRGVEFEKIVVQIFRKNGLEVEHTGKLQNHQFDLVIIKNSDEYGAELKISRGKYYNISYLKKVASNLKMKLGAKKYKKVILVIGNQIEDSDREEIEREFDLMIVDIIDLLVLTQKFEDLKIKLLTLLDYSVTDTELRKSDTQFFNTFFSTMNYNTFEIETNETNSGKQFLDKITKWDKDNHSEYENLCQEILEYLFNNELGLWHAQKNSNDGLYRLDLICRIKDDEVSAFWKMIQQYFYSKYIVFEFKNYKEKITQKEIYTTEKYLYTKALRGVAIMISRKGHDKNADKAIRGILRENGKLIISINNADLACMIKMKMNNAIPSDYLYEKLDDLLITLEK